MKREIQILQEGVASAFFGSVNSIKGTEIKGTTLTVRIPLSRVSIGTAPWSIVQGNT
jgi:hypothetical protein